MTTQDHPTETTESTDQAESMSEGTQSTPQEAEVAPEGTMTETRESTPEGTASTTERTESSAGETESLTEESLFGGDELSGLRARWDEVQSGFVDDPKDCVQKADSLLSDVVERLTTGFSEARSRLEAQWARGEEASTEDLRIALTRYREFFQRLLAV